MNGTALMEVENVVEGVNAARPPRMRLPEARERVDAESRDHWDQLVGRDSLALRDGLLALDDVNGQERRLTPTDWATGQLCARLGIPAPYFRRCPAVLQDMQANYWLKERSAARRKEKANEGDPDDTGESANANGRWLLRARGETLRAVLSERYSPLDNADLMDTLEPLLDARLRVDWFAHSDEGLHLRVIDPERAREVLPDDALSVGVHISNSEVGARALTVDALVYRLVCSNGLIRLVKGKSLLRQRHVHIHRERLEAGLTQAIGAAWQEAEGFLEQMRRTTLMPVEDVEGTLEKLGERWNLSDAVQDDLLQSLRREPAPVQETVYGVVNALTNVAQRQSDGSRYDLEVLAGHLAQHGVDSYAPRRAKAKQTVLSPGGGKSSDAAEGFAESDLAGNATAPTSFLDPLDPVEVAIGMFEARDSGGRIPVARRAEEANA